MKFSSSPLLLVSGPTACGKSDLAIRLALELSGEVVSVDSVQVYRECDIGSAKVSKEEQSQIPHHLIDIVDPSEPFDAGQFVREADTCIQEIQSRGRAPILCGGTTLYLTALIHGLANLPRGDPEWRSATEEKSTEELYQELRETDPESAKTLHANDRVRIMRALEICTFSESLASEKLKTEAFQKPRYDVLGIILCPNRDTLYEKINQRTEFMIDMGLQEEVQQLIKKYGSDIAPLKAIGYREAATAQSAESLYKEISQATRRYAKRQMTYWRNEPERRGWKIFPMQPLERPFKHGEKRHFETLKLQSSELIDKVQKRLQQQVEGVEIWHTCLK